MKQPQSAGNRSAKDVARLFTSANMCTLICPHVACFEPDNMLNSVLVVAERAQGEADWDGEDGDSSWERHQQTSTQHSLYRGNEKTWPTSEMSSLLLLHKAVWQIRWWQLFWAGETPTVRPEGWTHPKQVGCPEAREERRVVNYGRVVESRWATKSSQLYNITVSWFILLVCLLSYFTLIQHCCGSLYRHHYLSQNVMTCQSSPSDSN